MRGVKEMKLKEDRINGISGFKKMFKGKEKDVEYKIIERSSGSGYYVIARHIKKDLRLNSLWLDVKFKTVEDAQKWCETSPDIEQLRKECGLD